MVSVMRGQRVQPGTSLEVPDFTGPTPPVAQTVALGHCESFPPNGERS